MLDVGLLCMTDLMTLSMACVSMGPCSRQCLNRRATSDVKPLKEDFWVRERRACGPPSDPKMAASSGCLVRRRQSLRLAWSVSGSNGADMRSVQHLMAVFAGLPLNRQSCISGAGQI